MQLQERARQVAIGWSATELSSQLVMVRQSSYGGDDWKGRDSGGDRKG